MLAPVLQTYPCRERQIRSLATLLYPDAAPCRNLTIHGVEATGKTAITNSLLHNMSLRDPRIRHAAIDASQCITSRQLFETVVVAVSNALEWSEDDVSRRCETLAQLNVELCRMLKYPGRENFSFILVLDAIDRTRDASPTLLPGLARLSEIIPCLTTIFIVTAPSAQDLRTPSSPTIHFPPYTKPEYIRILALTPPAEPSMVTDDKDALDFLWPRFCAAVHDALVRSAAHSLPAFRHACDTLWPRFVAPIQKGTYETRDFSKLLVASRSHFHDETLLNPSIVSVVIHQPHSSTSSSSAPITTPANAAVASTDLSALLPRTARVLLLCAYLASHNAPRHDVTLFSTHYQKKRRRRGGGPTATGGQRSHRKIARKLIGAHAFVLERMLAIFSAVRVEWGLVTETSAGPGGGKGALDADVAMAMATLTSLRLLNRIGIGGDVMDRGGKWRINVGWDVVRGVGRGMGVEVDEWLID
ncbi:origin recognition complex subunit 5 [Geosmithia morbida]|uniref:Origin recognition complex subunit 5 n=1 Tax=Geosmithia morbida TaxID=1094350 RepID=A0A9P4YSQ5_9HYPO|nr:origin recognition complex subunit 5 [Geosmithia morbida]KAF4120956.1 origin recognition complex subunit 5 [Geosmithia morbida]